MLTLFIFQKVVAKYASPNNNSFSVTLSSEYGMSFKKHIVYLVAQLHKNFPWDKILPQYSCIITENIEKMYTYGWDLIKLTFLLVQQQRS